MITASVVRAAPASSAMMRPRLNTSARWQMWATSSKSVETTTTARPVLQRARDRGGRSPPWRRHRRRPSDPRRSAACARWRASGRPRPSAGCRPTGPRSADRDRWAAGRPRRRARRPARASAAGDSGENRPRPAAPGLRKAFSRTRQRGRDGFLRAVAGDEADAGLQAPRAARRGPGASPSSVIAPRCGDGAEQRAADLLLAGAAQADQAEQLALADVEVDRPGARRDEAARPRRGPCRTRARPSGRARASSGRRSG